MKRSKFPPRVFDDPALSLRKATSTTHQEREHVEAHMRTSLGGVKLPPVLIGGTLYRGGEYRP